MAATLERFGREFRAAFEDVHEAMRSCRNVRPLPVVVPTITFTGKFDDTKLPVDVMRLAAELAAEMEESDAEDTAGRLEFTLVGDEYGDGGKRRTTTDIERGADGGLEVRGRPAQPRARSAKTFRGQLSLKRRGKSIKLFHNGSVHVTGCGCPLEFLEVVEALRDFVRDTGGKCVNLTSFDIHMVNAMFTLTCPRTGRPMTVAPSALLRHLAVPAFMDPENNPSVTVPHVVDGRKVATAFVFGTGNVNVLGAKRPAHMASCVRAVCAMLDEAAPRVCAPDKVTMRTTTSKHGLTLSEGYPFSLLACCLF